MEKSVVIVDTILEQVILNEGAVWRGMIEWRVDVNIWQEK